MPSKPPSDSPAFFNTHSLQVNTRAKDLAIQVNDYLHRKMIENSPTCPESQLAEDVASCILALEMLLQTYKDTAAAMNINYHTA